MSGTRLLTRKTILDHRRSWIEVKPTALMRYHAQTRWKLTFDLDL